jgi:hypothetical protein
MNAVAVPTMRRLPSDAPEIQRRLQTMMEGDTVEFITEHGVPVSVSRTDKGLDTNIKVKVTCQTARILAGALFALAFLGALAAFLDGEGEFLTVAGLAIDRALVEEIATKIANGVAFETLVFFLAQHFC